MAKDKLSGQLIGPLKIETLANGGNGIAREQGRVIFVSGAFPGDVVLCRLTKEKKSYAEAEVVELQQPSPLRRTAPCPVADECGGCQWQQLPYSEQLKWKQQLFAETLTRQTVIEPACIQSIVPAPEEFGYRSRVQVKCFHSAKGFFTGFFRPKSRSVVGIEECPLMAPRLNQLLAALRDCLAGSLFAKQIPQLDLAVGFDNKSRAVVHYLGDDKSGIAALLLPLAKQFCFDLAIQHKQKGAPLLICGNGDLCISVDQPEVVLSYAIGGFAQINLKQNQNLVQAVLAAASLKGHEQILDLYCGMGNFSLPLARRVEHVTGVEDFTLSINMARHNATVNGIANVDFHAMSAEHALQTFDKDFDLLVLDPPRTGAFTVVKQLVKQQIPKIIYVSCDPQTLARDLKLLLSCGYQIVSSQAFDMFPQTFHVETVTVLEHQPL